MAGDVDESHARAIARIHMAAWEATYRGLIDDAVLDGLREDALTAEWGAELRAPSDPAARVVGVWSADRDSTMWGYCRFGPCHDADVDPVRSGEIHGLYVHPDHWGHGLGRVLLEMAMDRLRLDRMREVRLWVAERNERARRFYERQGFVLEGGENDFHGVREVRYVRPLEPLPGSERQADTLAGECARISDAIHDAGEEVFARPTRCAGWNVAQLLAHLWRDLDWLRQAASQSLDRAAEADAVTYWRFHADNDAGAFLAEEAVRIATELRRASGVRLRWEHAWRTAVDLILETEPELVVTTWGPAMTFEDFVETRILEVAVHGLDLADALGMQPWLTDDAAASATAVLVQLLGSDPRPSLGWDDPTFIDAATGRRPLTTDERRALGDEVDRFPILT